MRHYRIVGTLATCVVVLLAAMPSSAAESLRPNVVFILADDLGWSDLCCYGADLHETPHIDRLASEGVRFTQAYAMPVCSPTRAAIMTGKHAARLHITIWREGAVERDVQAANTKRLFLDPVTTHDLPFKEVTLAHLLKKAGYLTFHVGKWHLGGPQHYPENHGFDVNIGGTLWGAPNSFLWPYKGNATYKEPRYVPGLGLGQPGDFLTDRLTDEAIKLIETANGRPFFLNLCYHAPHTPIEGKPALVEQYRAKLKPALRHQNASYAAMIHTLDSNVGRVLDTLKTLGLAEQTLVIFASDNGGFVNEFRGQRVTTNYPLRSGKGSLYEGGVRVPLIVRLPGFTARQGVCEEPVMCTDFFPTIAEAIGTTGGDPADGISFARLLRDPSAKLRRQALYFHYPHYYATTSPVSAIRAGDWKLLEYYERNRTELYNLKDDLGEEHDLAAMDPDRVRDLRNRLHSWRRQVGAMDPVPNPNATRSRGK